MRTKLYPMGLLNLSETDFVKVSVGNCLLHASLKIVRLCKKNKIAVTFENPLRSQMWWVPSMQRLARYAQRGTSSTRASVVRIASTHRHRTRCISGLVAPRARVGEERFLVLS